MDDEQLPDATDPGLLDETLEEHRHTMEFVSRLEECLDRPPDNKGQWVNGLLTNLPEVARAMRSHFVSEEQGSLYTEIPRNRPRFAAKLEALKEEHPRMLEEINEIIERTGQLREGQLWELRELNARIQLFIARIRRHEAVENELLYELYWEDIGVGD